MRTDIWILLGVLIFGTGCGNGFQQDSNLKKTVTASNLLAPGWQVPPSNNPSVACQHGSKGQVPDFTALVNQFSNQRGLLLDDDCKGTSNNYIGELVIYLRAQTRDYRIGYNGVRSERDTISYLWDNGSCEGSTNVTVIDVISGYGSCINTPQASPISDAGSWSSLPPPNSGTGKAGNGPPNGSITTPPITIPPVTIVEHLDLVQQIRSQINPTDEFSAFEVTKRVAWDLRGEGGGLLIKNIGANIVSWNGYSFSAGRMCYQHHMIKIISDVGAGGANGPSWQDQGLVNDSECVPAMSP